MRTRRRDLDHPSDRPRACLLGSAVRVRTHMCRNVCVGALTYFTIVSSFDGVHNSLGVLRDYALDNLWPHLHIGECNGSECLN